ncbi:DUF58 domain-containing protein [Natrinema sp. SYSU A 869]|uniref:DUF58 domain-containing protein n=1 Tax=Natrinema sp. SYSU A 869 TaxID=2871694 RepID=UPI00210822C5|nr:DUF58 domain-containing protein [Natrinema sp. SYSU A 869]
MALTVVLAILAMVFARPLTLVGAALVGTWFLTHQYRFARDLERTVASLSVVQSTAQTSVHTGDVIPVTLGATREADTALTVEITAGLPVASEATKPFTVTLESTIERADRMRMVTWPVAGNHSFEGATVTATDGLFRETLTAGPAPMVTVEPPSTQRVHVGEGGNQVAASYGSHDAGQAGSGIELAELREYVPGDQGKEIDWKATARHATPYVRKYEAETDRRTLLVVDHRASLTTGPGTITKLNTLREVALVIAGNARRLNDPLGLVTVGDDGITNRLSVASPSVNYGPVKRHLLDLTPTIEANANQTDPFSGRANSNSTNGPRDSVSPSTHSEARSSTTVGSSGNGTTLARRHTGPRMYNGHSPI